MNPWIGKHSYVPPSFNVLFMHRSFCLYVVRVNTGSFITKVYDWMEHCTDTLYNLNIDCIRPVPIRRCFTIFLPSGR